MKFYIQQKGIEIEKQTIKLIDDFFSKFKTIEFINGTNNLLFLDEKSSAFYIICHLDAKTISENTDLDAVLDPLESEEYKLNRGIYVDSYAYKRMESDAIEGRSFEDIVVEYDNSYRGDKPLKIFGGQHRVVAIKKSLDEGTNKVHGLRVYFGLTTEQKFEIAMVNNTAIAVSNDLLDRMQEELLGSELRDWCQSVGLLGKGENFADKRNPGGIITVRVARTLIVNFFEAKATKMKDYHLPVVCTSGTSPDKRYMNIRRTIDWNDPGLKQMGKQFAQLHWMQRDKVLKRGKDKHMEFVNKAIHPCVAAAWSYGAGLYQNDKDNLSKHYALVTSDGDPLNAKALSEARLKGTDPDTYRGIGARINNEELGRMLAVFMLQAEKAEKRGITEKIANLAIKAHQSAKTKNEYEKSLKKGL